VDDDLDFHDWEFRFRGKAVFQVHHHCPWRRFQSKWDLRHIFETELSQLIANVVGAYHASQGSKVSC
jgi:hypothetical protein